MRGLFVGLAREIERLSLEFSLIAWHANGAVRDWTNCRIAGTDAVVVEFRTRLGEMTLTILPRGERWCVYRMPDTVVVEDRFPRVVDALRLLVDSGEGSATVH